MRQIPLPRPVKAIGQFFGAGGAPRNRSRAVLPLAGVVMGATLAFALLAYLVASGHTQAWDLSIVERLRSPNEPGLPRGPIWLVEAVRDISALGSPTLITITVLAAAITWALARRYRAAVLLPATVATGALLSEGLKQVFDRDRPPFPSALTHPLSSSFPSGHSLLSSLTFLSLGLLLASQTSRPAQRWWFLGLAMMLTLLVGASRVVLGVHYPSDVAGGWLIGCAWAAAWRLIGASFENNEHEG